MRITPQIRPATVADAEALTELAARTFYDAFADMNTAENIKAYMSKAFTVEQLTAELSDPLGKFLIAETGGVIVGYAKLLTGNVPACVTGQNPIELVRLYVDKTCLGSGVGNDLMQASLDEARSLGHRTPGRTARGPARRRRADRGGRAPRRGRAPGSWSRPSRCARTRRSHARSRGRSSRASCRRERSSAPAGRP